MSKKIKSVILSAVVLVVLIGIVIALLLLKEQDAKKASEPTSSGPSSFVTLIEENRGNTEWLRIKNTKGEYKIVPTGENVYSAEGIEDLPQANYVYLETLAAACNVVATETIEENASDLGKYGLVSPELTFELKIKDKESITISIGNLSPDKSIRYGKKADSNTVYAFPTTAFSTLYFGKLDYLDGALVPGFDPNNDPESVPVIEKVVVTRPDLEKPLIFEEIEAEYYTENTVMQAKVRMTSPVTALLSETPAQEYIYGNFGIGAEEIVDIKPDEADIEKYGFNNPTSTYEVTYSGGKTVKVKTGKGVECRHTADEDLTDHKHTITYHYAMREGSDLVYLMKTDSMRWFKMQPKDVMSKYAIIPSVYDLESVDLNVNGKDYKLTYETEVLTDKKAVTGGAVNGKAVDPVGASTFLQLLGSTAITDINTAPVTEKPSVTIKYNYKNGKKADVVELIVTADRTCIVSLNGEKALKGRSGLIAKIEMEMDKLLKGEKLDLTW